MNTIFKTIVSLMVTALVPIVEFGLLFVLFLAFIVFLPNPGPGSAPSVPVDLGELSAALLAVAGMLLLGFLVSLTYTFLLGLPALLIGWYFRAIRWWTTLLMAFLIGAIPAAFSTLVAPLGQPEGTPLWRSMDFGALFLVGSGTLMFGMIGLSCGLVFWLLWRYWVQPASPAGRPRRVEMKPAPILE